MEPFAPEIKWKHPLTEREQPHYLKGVVTVAGVEFHAEAWEVQDFEDVDEADGSKLVYQQTLPNGGSTGDDIINHIVDGDVQTIEIEGKTYLFAITPYQR